MNLGAIGERFAKVPQQSKALILVGAALVVAALFYVLVYSDMGDESQNLTNRINELTEERASFEDKKQRYMAFRAEVKKLLQANKDLVKILPTRAEIPSLLQTLHAQAELAGLSLVTFDRQTDVTKGFYAEIPVRMVVNGTYHQISRFLFSIGRLRRIVNITEVQMTEPKAKDSGVVLKANLLASTYRFINKKSAKKPGQG